MSEKYAGFGAKLQYLDGVTWTDIAGVRDIDGPGLEASMVDVTNHGSPGAVREFIKSIIEAGDVSFDLVWDPEDAAGQRVLMDRMLLISDEAIHPYRLVWPSLNSKTWQFDAAVQSFKPGAPVEGELSASCALKVDGLPNFDAA